MVVICPASSEIKFGTNFCDSQEGIIVTGYELVPQLGCPLQRVHENFLDLNENEDEKA